MVAVLYVAIKANITALLAGTATEDGRIDFVALTRPQHSKDELTKLGRSCVFAPACPVTCIRSDRSFAWLRGESSHSRPAAIGQKQSINALQ